MPTYIFELGREQEISLSEIKAAFGLWNMEHSFGNKTKEYLEVTTKKELDPQMIMDRLGGTIKIAELVESNGDSEQTIVHFLEDTHPEAKIHFSLSGTKAKKKALGIKKELKSYGRSVRYIEPKNTATIIHNNLVQKQGDFTILNNTVFVTRAVQDIEAFGERDYGRPGRDSQSGMLPPKLARIMINLSETKEKGTILDPFCGSGTVLMEAALMGYKNIIGSDNSQKAIEDTEKNLEWLRDKYRITDSKYKLHNLDATKLSDKLKPNSVDSIVTEPFMGKPIRGNEVSLQRGKQMKELKRLYIDTFKSFQKILKPGATVIFIIPKFRYKDDWITIDCLDEIKNQGFDIIPFSEKNTSLLYWRKDQFVGREIWKFKKK